MGSVQAEVYLLDMLAKQSCLKLTWKLTPSKLPLVLWS